MNSSKNSARLPHEIAESIEEFIYNVEHKDISSMYSVGDWIKFETAGGTLTAYIAGFNHDTLAQAGDSGDTATVTLLAHQTFIAGRFTDGGARTYDSHWGESEIRNHTIPILFSALPDCLREHIVPVRKLCMKSSTDCTVVEIIDKLWLPSEIEYGIYGITSSAADLEGETYEIFLTEHAGEKLLSTAYTSPFQSLRSTCANRVGTYGIELGTLSRKATNSFFPFTFGFCLTNKHMEQQSMEAAND